MEKPSENGRTGRHAREREHWRAMWLLALGGLATELAEALERNAHSVDGLEAISHKGQFRITAAVG